jgi:hypothetical protein
LPSYFLPLKQMSVAALSSSSVTCFAERKSPPPKLTPLPWPVLPQTNTVGTEPAGFRRPPRSARRPPSGRWRVYPRPRRWSGRAAAAEPSPTSLGTSRRPTGHGLPFLSLALKSSSRSAAQPLRRFFIGRWKAEVVGAHSLDERVLGLQTLLVVDDIRRGTRRCARTSRRWHRRSVRCSSSCRPNGRPGRSTRPRPAARGCRAGTDPRLQELERREAHGRRALAPVASEEAVDALPAFHRPAPEQVEHVVLPTL